VGALLPEGDEPVGWLSLGPAEEFRPRLSRWSVAKGVLDDATVEGVWVINCLYVPSERRRTGISGRLIEAAVVHAHRAGARAVIAFPLLAEARSLPEGATGVGYAEPFLAAGFELVPGALDSRAWAVRRLRPEPPPG